MNTIIVWLLVSVSTGYYNAGTVTVVGQFPTSQSCEFVRQSMPRGRGEHEARCIQTAVVK